ncbi:MAG TPA: citrate/2-methylcitrate synthase [Chthonomonas sp.]|jgi:2-methylcitrate synthase/citrate synthase II|uniref:citrate/2-methylcitrate synthase n=1 Tax=Chthonomonas sp. TaxID=2282153 RepID=UPI002B4B695E|nr:citrate/2-methylcitrate synthase [Chthonomonas sp.]HLH80682.1 citrate/2-methylcitrate synthase [Chthonomonas sp.]
MPSASYSPGLEGIVAGLTAISKIDAERNRLSYRGYDIHDLVDHCSFDEVAYLLIYGDLPNQSQLDAFCKTVGAHRGVPSEVISLLRTLPSDASQMDRVKAAVAALALFDPQREERTAEAYRAVAVRLYAQLPTIIVNSYRLSQGQEPATPRADLNHNTNFFWMLTGHEPSDLIGHAFNVSQILYAEHGYNASTFAARVTVSTLSDIYSGVVSAIGTLKGPLHGGANEASMQMLLEIGSPERAAEWVREALARKQRIMGFGHREYKHGDERARIAKQYVIELANSKGATHWLEMADIIEREMMQAKGLYPNVDFPIGLLYYLMDIPIPLYTPIFMMSRITGWCAHIIEQLENNRLIRPESEYIGPSERPVLPLPERP